MLSGLPTEQSCSLGSPEHLRGVDKTQGRERQEDSVCGGCPCSYVLPRAGPTGYLLWVFTGSPTDFHGPVSLLWASKSRMSPTMRPCSSGKCREVRQSHSFQGIASGPGDQSLRESSQAGRGEPGAYWAALLMLPSPVTYDLGAPHHWPPHMS